MMPSDSSEVNVMAHGHSLSTVGVADRLRLYRQERGWTQAQLARRAGVSAGTVSRLELGDEPDLT